MTCGIDKELDQQLYRLICKHGFERTAEICGMTPKQLRRWRRGI